jgi:NTP pyrophosphatase (non-canonical NTP hydrolase)
MNPDVYQAAAVRTEADPCKSASRMESMLPVDPNSPDSLHLMPVRINHAVVGLAGEVGELAQLLERWVYYGQSLSVPDVEEEVGDCLWYLALLCNTVGISMERAMEGNIAKLKARYPHKFTEEAAANRDPTAERKASEEVMEKAKADRLKQLIERYSGVSDKPVSEIYPPPDEKAKEQDSQPEWASGTVYGPPPEWALDYDERMKIRAEQDKVSGGTTPAPRKPVDLSNPVVVLPGSIPVPGVWACECGQLNADRRIVCDWCNKRRKGYEDWACACGHINVTTDPQCTKCEKPRVVELVAPEQPGPDSSGVEQAPGDRPPDQPNCDSVGLDEAQRNQSNCDSVRSGGAQRDQPNPFGYDEAGEFEDL